MLASPNLSLKFQKKTGQLQNFHPILLSPMTFWEISLLVQRGRISLEMDCLEWVEQALCDPGFHVAELTPQIAVLSSRLPGTIHGDPVDRILIHII